MQVFFKGKIALLCSPYVSMFFDYFNRLSPGGSDCKESTCNAGDLGWEDTLEKGTATHFTILVWRISQRGSLAGCSPWGHKELDTTEWLSLSLWAFFGIASLWHCNENWSFPDHCWVFQIFWHTECSTLTDSPIRIWNSSAGIASPPLALCLVVLPNAHLTSHSRITTIVVSQVIKTFLYRSSVYSCHLFLISSASVRLLLFFFHIVHLCMKSYHGVPNFLEEISSLSILLFSSIFLHCSL